MLDYEGWILPTAVTSGSTNDPNIWNYKLSSLYAKNPQIFYCPTQTVTDLTTIRQTTYGQNSRISVRYNTSGTTPDYTLLVKLINYPQLSPLCLVSDKLFLTGQYRLTADVIYSKISDGAKGRIGFIHNSLTGLGFGVGNMLMGDGHVDSHPWLWGENNTYAPNGKPDAMLFWYGKYNYNGTPW